MSQNPDGDTITTIIASNVTLAASEALVSDKRDLADRQIFNRDEIRRLGYSTLSTTPQAFDIGGVGFPQRRVVSTTGNV